MTLARNCLVFEKIASIQFGDKQTTDAVASTPTPTIQRGLKNHWHLGLCTNRTGRAYSAPKTFRRHFAALEGAGGMRREGRREGKGGGKGREENKGAGWGTGGCIHEVREQGVPAFQWAHQSEDWATSYTYAPSYCTSHVAEMTLLHG